MSNFFSRLFPKRESREELINQRLSRVNQMFDKIQLGPKVIDCEAEIIAKNPGKKGMELYNLLFDIWHRQNPPEGEAAQKAFAESTIKQDESRQNMLFYLAEIYRIKAGIPLQDFDKGTETTEFIFVLQEEGYDFVAMETDPSLKAVLTFMMKYYNKSRGL